MSKNRSKIGYALGGGAARGLFHIGVLNILEKYGIYPDCIVGTSIGAIIGALYASGLKAGELKEIALRIEWKQLIHLADITLPLSGLIQGRRVVSLLKSIVKETSFSQLQYEFACVCTDIRSGEQVVLSEGSLIEAVRASISMPGIFTPVKINGRYLVDGGLINVVPVNICRQMGADFVIGVNVISGPGENAYLSQKIQHSYDEQLEQIGELTGLQKLIKSDNRVRISRIVEIDNAIRNFFLYGQPKFKKLIAKSSKIPEITLKRLSLEGPNMMDVMSQSLNIIEYHLATENLRDADLAISPASETIGSWEFYRAAEAIKAGEKATEEVLRKDAVARILLSS